MVESELDGEDTADVVATLTTGLTDAPVDVLDVFGIEFRDFREERGNHLAREFVRPDVFEGSLTGAADRGAGMGNDDGFSHVKHVTARRRRQMSRICHSTGPCLSGKTGSRRVV